MKTCIKCNLKYDDDCVFCNKCGSKLHLEDENTFCQYCGMIVDDNSDFCPFCGKKISVDMKQKVDVNNLQKDKVYQPANKMISDKNDYLYSVNDSKEPFFSKHHLFSYDGRRGRSSYFNVMLFWRFILFIPDKFLSVITDKADDIGSVLFVIVLSLLMSYPSFCNIAKRLHDLNVSTNHAVCYFVFVQAFFMALEIAKGSGNSTASTIIALVLIGMAFPLLFAKGTAGPNQYGEDPTKE